MFEVYLSREAEKVYLKATSKTCLSLFLQT